MPNINIEVTDELLKAIRLACAESGETQAVYIARLVEESNEDGRDGLRVRGDVKGGTVGQRAKRVGKSGKAVSRAHEEGGPPNESGAVDRSAKADRGREGKGETRKCELHGKVMKDFGNAWVCEGPPSHKEMK